MPPPAITSEPLVPYAAVLGAASVSTVTLPASSVQTAERPFGIPPPHVHDMPTISLAAPPLKLTVMPWL
jgi:hypothetical protein